MSLIIKRLDCPGYITAMIAIVSRHALLADGARQQALDEIARNLHNIDVIIQRHKLAPVLAAPIPPIPVVTAEDGEDEPDIDIDVEDVADAGEPAATPAKITPSQGRVLSYIRTHPGCSTVEIASALSISKATISIHLSVLRQAGYTIEMLGRPARYRLIETENK
ncbi:MAG TPA: helix-turn-helix domain-containing protein [Caldilineaceae bacterium]|nr:helix-turn-helix domain-containing protein [Caldilineaceae bacterium]